MPRKAKQPTRVAPGQQYGERKRQEQAQQVAPLPDQSEQLQQLAQQFNPTVERINQPGRPDQPLTAGAPGGPGPGPEVLPAMPAPNPESFSIMQAARLLPILEAIGSRKQLTPATVRFIRQVRSNLPPSFDFQQIVDEENGPQDA